MAPCNTTQNHSENLVAIFTTLFIIPSTKLQIHGILWCKLMLGCKYVDKSHRDYFTKGLWILLSFFSFFYKKELLNEIFCNLLLKIHIVAPIDHIFCVNHCWINIKISKCVNLANFLFSSWNLSFWIIPKYVNYFRFLFLISWTTTLFSMSCTLHPIYM